MDSVMEARRRLLMMADELPGIYRRVEYLESKWEQYINTGILPAQDLSFKCKFLTTSNVAGGYGNVFGSRTASARNEYQLSAYNGGTVSVGTRNTVGGITINEVHVVEFDGDNVIYVDGAPQTITTSSLTSNNHRIFLFGLDQAGNFIQGEKTRIYSCSFGNLRNFIPCVRKSDNKPGMYDTVTKTFFTNSGTGEFIVPS